MRRCFVALSVLIIFLLSFCMSVSAAQQSEKDHDNSENLSVADELYDSLQLNELYQSLPKSAQDSLARMGIEDVSVGSVSELTLSLFVGEVLAIAGEQSVGVLASLSMTVAVLLIYSLVEGFTQSLANDSSREVLSVVCALCIACALVIPVTDLIDTANKAIYAASDFMLAYVPVMVAVLVSCGRTLSGSGYYTLMIAAAEGISRLSSKFITPMLNVFLGVSISSAVTPAIRLDSLTSMFSKTIKWLLSFSFTIFSAFLTFKTLITTSIDSVSTRAVRYTLSSFIPVVGSALSEAYKTVQGSVNILKNGVGVFVIIAVSAVFLPVILRLMLWIFSVGICRSFAQIINLGLPVNMLSSVSTVLSVLLAVILCIMALFIISTALIVTVGGNSI